MRRSLLLAIVIALVFTLAEATLVGMSAASTYAANDGERLTNGSFEEGFGDNGVAIGWTGFESGGQAEFKFADDTGPRFAVDGTHSQFIRISTLPYFATEPDRYAGMYQTVSVVAGARYTLALSGMLRLLPDDPDKNNWSYVVQWGMDPNGGTDWGKVAWHDVPWSTTYDENDTGAMSRFTVPLTAPSDKITLFIRVLKKFATRDRVLYANLDAVSLVGPVPPLTNGIPKLDVSVASAVYTTKPFKVHVAAFDTNGVSAIELYDDGRLVGKVTHTGSLKTREVDFSWTPASANKHTLLVYAQSVAGISTSYARSVQVVPIAELLKNGDFEQGFANGTGLGWSSFDNGGNHVVHLFQDDTWTPVVSRGAHSQLIGISTMGWDKTDPISEPDRRAGICQVVSGLTINAAYYLTVNGALRVTEGEEHTDDWSWSAQWGYEPGADPTCQLYNKVENWQTLPWQHVDYRESPTRMNTFDTMFYAPSDTLTLYFSAWKKWPIGAREFLVNLDNLSLAGYKAP